MLKSVLFVIIASLLVASCNQPADPEPATPTRRDSLQIFTKAFNPPESCQTCHPKQYQDWEMSMHAYALEDPLFQSMNELGLKQTNGLLGEFCIRCHAPIASQLSETEGGVLVKNPSPAGRRAVTCESCHKSEAQQPGHVISKFRLDGMMYGPFSDPAPNTFHGSMGKADMEQSTQCSGCHEVINPRGVRVEATFTEWQNSLYPARAIPCQVCHMKWDSGYAAVGAPKKRRVHSHVMEGVDVPLTDFPGRDDMITRVGYLLNNSVHTEFFVPQSIKRGEKLELNFELSNTITGHNLPSGTIFERQMWVVIDVTNENGDTLFHSGQLDPNGDLLNEHSEYVLKGQIARDSTLVLFNGIAYRLGKEIPFFFDADAVVNHTIAPFETRNARYFLDATRYKSATHLKARVRLLMRALPPYIMRMLGHASLVDKVPIFTMEDKTAEVVIE